MNAHTQIHIYPQQLEHVRYGSKGIVLPQHIQITYVYTHVYAHTHTYTHSNSSMCASAARLPCSLDMQIIKYIHI